MNKKEAIELVRTEGWTKADAERAFQSLDFSRDVSERDVWITLSKFAGSELEKRQRLQAAQKGLVTKHSKQIKDIELNHATTIRNYEDNLQKERSQWRQILGYVYNKAKSFGFNDALIEKIQNQDDAA